MGVHNDSCSIESTVLSVYCNFHVISCHFKGCESEETDWALLGDGLFFFSTLLDFFLNCTNPFVWRTSGPSPHKQSALVSVALWLL